MTQFDSPNVVAGVSAVSVLMTSARSGHQRCSLFPTSRQMSSMNVHDSFPPPLFNVVWVNRACFLWCGVISYFQMWWCGEWCP
jgi:hypothetical protein